MTLSITTAEIIRMLRDVVTRKDDFVDGVSRIAIAITDDELLRDFLAHFGDCMIAEADDEKLHNGIAGLIAIGIVTGIVANAQELKGSEAIN